MSHRFMTVGVAAILWLLVSLPSLVVPQAVGETADDPPTRYPYPVQTIWADGTATAGTGTSQWLTAYARWLNTTPAAPWPFQVPVTATSTTTATPNAWATERAIPIQTAIAVLQTALAITQTATARATMTPGTTPTRPATAEPTASSTAAAPVLWLPFTYRYRRPTPRPRW